MAGQPQGSPGELDQPRDRTPQKPEQTPDGPKEPEDQADEKSESDKQPGDGKPESPEQNPPTGENTPDADPEDKQGVPVAASMDKDRWGELPTRVRETFRNQGQNELPVQYREWIDAYYRRLSRQR